MSEIKTLYDKDFVGWSKEQAEALRAAAHGATNQPIDWENVAEEIGDLGKSERRELGSRLSIVIEHLTKLAHSRSRNPLKGWRQTVRRQRAEIERILDGSPSLRREVPLLIEKEKKRTIELVIAELSERDELRASAAALRARSYADLCPYTPDQLLGDWFPDEPAGGSGKL